MSIRVQFYRGQGSYNLLLRHEPILKVSLASIPCTGLEISTWKFIPINWRKDTKFLGTTYLSHPAPVILQGSNNPRHHLRLIIEIAISDYDLEFRIWSSEQGIQNLTKSCTCAKSDHGRKMLHLGSSFAFLRALYTCLRLSNTAPQPLNLLRLPLHLCDRGLDILMSYPDLNSKSIDIRSASPCTCVKEMCIRKVLISRYPCCTERDNN